MNNDNSIVDSSVLAAIIIRKQGLILLSRQLEENPDISKDTHYAIITSRRKIPKVRELETIHATVEQQQEMERLLKKQ